MNKIIIKHGNHIDIIANNRLFCKYDDKSLSHQVITGKCNSNNISGHMHNINNLIPHLDHYDYLVNGRLHYIHDDHCDDHGEINLIDESDIIDDISPIRSIRSYWKFIIMILLTGGFFLVELISGIIIQSLALQADAFHMLTDLSALIISLYSDIASQREANNRATYGMVGAEIIGSLINSIFLLSSCLFIVSEALHRFIDFNSNDQKSLDNNTLIIVGCIGLFVNLIGMIMFGSSASHGHSHNYNINALLLHITGDLLGSVGVIISGIIIRFADGKYKYLADPISSLFIVILIMIGVIPLIKRCISILLHKVPTKIDINEIRNEILKLNNIIDVYNFHIWQLNDIHIIGTLNVLIQDEKKNRENFMKIGEIMRSYQIYSTTIQIDYFNEINSVPK